MHFRASVIRDNAWKTLKAVTTVLHKGQWQSNQNALKAYAQAGKHPKARSPRKYPRISYSYTIVLQRQRKICQ